MIFNNNNNDDVVQDKVLLMTDCAIIANPTSEQLVDIAQATSKSAEYLLTDAPHLLLCFRFQHMAALNIQWWKK